MSARLLTASLLVLVFGAPAVAEEEKKPRDPAKVFAKKDTNSDGALSLEEYKTGLKDKALENADKRFKRTDTDGDGKLSLKEFKAGMPAKK